MKGKSLLQEIAQALPGKVESLDPYGRNFGWYFGGPELVEEAGEVFLWLGLEAEEYPGEVLAGLGAWLSGFNARFEMLMQPELEIEIHLRK